MAKPFRGLGGPTPKTSLVRRAQAGGKSPFAEGSGANASAKTSSRNQKVGKRASVKLFPRFAAPRLIEALRDSPVVLVHGPRQCGKTTLAQMVGDRLGHAYFSFDDDVVRAAAQADPAGFLFDLPDRVILDEVQRVPQMFAALKLAVDRRREAGRFILTGSANVLLVPHLSDSLAGRMQILRLHPLSQAEVARQEPRFIDDLFSGRFGNRSDERLGRRLADRIVAGGFPAALARPSETRRAAWYRDFAETLMVRDVRDLARIGALDAVPRLMAAIAAQTARLQNIAELGAPFELTRPTIRDYVTLLERIFVVDRLPSWHSNRLSRLVKTPKLHVGDTGLACALLGIGADDLFTDRALYGQLVESFVVQEIRRQASWRREPIAFSHFRNKNGDEVDLVLELGVRSLAGVEVKSSGTVTASDFRGLIRLRDAAGKKFAAGVILYDGATEVGFGDRLFAVPVSRLWKSDREA